jgi:hypothetical protein
MLQEEQRKISQISPHWEKVLVNSTGEQEKVVESNTQPDTEG